MRLFSEDMLQNKINLINNSLDELILNLSELPRGGILKAKGFEYISYLPNDARISNCHAGIEVFLSPRSNRSSAFVGLIENNGTQREIHTMSHGDSNELPTVH
jgi:hypothetical protein